MTVPSPASALTLLQTLRDRLGDGVSAFELIAGQGIEFRAPLATSPALAAALTRLREDVAGIAEDRLLAPDLEAAAGLIRSGALAGAAGLELLA